MHLISLQRIFLSDLSDQSDWFDWFDWSEIPQ